jgi:hypothetical protein
MMNGGEEQEKVVRLDRELRECARCIHIGVFLPGLFKLSG